MKTLIYITGTNCSGKSTIARKIIEYSGGVTSVEKHCGKSVSVCRDNLALAGLYNGVKFGGADGFCETKCFEGVARSVFKSHDTIVFEGMYVNTFGNNLINAAFAAEKQLVVFLYTPAKELQKRLRERSATKLDVSFIKRQGNVARAARKWASIGIPLLVIDTSKTSIEESAKQIMDKITKISGKTAE